ncbi:uncharacterized protein LOC134222731 [Armigeres subalbatus]|uniref:uncharacterized protein LOC134222731 n=1 Tax=Armigeres subalbatus TaxID=124917 RepID=UPI002ED5ABD6
MSPSLRTLSRQERFYLDTMTNIKRFVENFNVERDVGQLEGWKQRAEVLYADFQANRLQIELFGEDTDKKDTDEEDAKIAEEANRLIRQGFENDFVRVHSFLTSEYRKSTTPQSIVPATTSDAGNLFNHPYSRIKLPEVKLPTFSGCVSEWITFRDTFKSLIDSNLQLSPIDKMSYLVASLSKDARKVVESVEHTAANYPVAWNLLEKRFDNKKLVVRTLIDALFSIEPLKRECYESLMHLVDDFERNLCMIDKMGILTKDWSVLLAHMVCSKLNSSTLKQWETYHKSTEVPKYEDVIKFLRTHLTVLHSLTPSKPRLLDTPKPESYRSQKSKINTVHTVTTTSSSPSSCPFCSTSPHSPFKCGAFQKLSVVQRFEQVKKKGLCINCFSSSHLPRQSSTAESQSPSANATSLISTTLVGSFRTVPATVLLQTAIVKIFDSHGHTHCARALLDPASQLSLVTENLVQKLQLRRYSDRQEIGGVGNSLVVSYHAVPIRMGSRCSDFVTDVQCHILKKITRELPARCIDTSAWNIPSNLALADPQFHKPGPIDLLIGMEMYYDLLLEGFLKLGPEKPVLQNTVLEWMGQAPTLARFWEIESCWNKGTFSLEETACEEHFSSDVSRDESGRFVVTLPKRSSMLNLLGSSKEIATRRFLALERRLQSNPKLMEAYSAFIEEYHKLNHMREVVDEEISASGISYYLPHHGVEKADSTTTK